MSSPLYGIKPLLENTTSTMESAQSVRETAPPGLATQNPITAPRLAPLAVSGKDARPKAFYQFLGIFLVLAVASLMRLLALNSLGFNSDEAVYAGQAAAIAQAPVLSDLFPVFRAHPLLYQFIIAILFQFAVSDLLARLVSVLLGIGTVFLVYRLGEVAYGPSSGLLAALFIAVMPYHVLVSRQVLLDGPLTFFTTLALFFLVRFAISSRSRWLYATGAAMGLAFLSKETGIIFTGAIFAFLALTPKVRLRLRDLVITVFCMLLVASPFPLTTLLAGGGGSQRTQQYLIWQLFRPPNHEWDFYLTNVPVAIGPLLILVTAIGLLIWHRKWTWRESLFLAWIIVPAAFFQLWPTKGFQYLLPIAPPVALLGGKTLSGLLVNNQKRGKGTPPNGKPNSRGRRNVLATFGSILTAAVVITLAIPSWGRIFPSPELSFLAGSGGVPGGRETGLWIRENIPQGATFLTIGPSMANILQFYGQRRALGLSVSPNPLHRNPSYLPVTNPDIQIRNGDIHYLVWDAYSASRSLFFSDKLLYYARKYDGRVIFTQTVQVTSPLGETVDKAVTIIYEVYP